MIPKSNLYEDTEAAAASTRAEIDKLLRKFGIMEKRWTELGPENTFLEFIIRQQGRPPVKVRINVPYIEKRGRYNHKELSYNEPRSYRYFYHYLKALLSAKDAEISSIEEVFMAHIVQPLPDGRETTLGEQLNKALEKGNAPALEGFTVVASKLRPELERIN